MNNNNATATSSFRRFRQISTEISSVLRDMKIDRQYTFSLYYLNAGEDLRPSNLYYCDTFLSMREIEARILEAFQGDSRLNGKYIVTINSKFVFEYMNINNRIISKIIQ